MRLLVAMDGTDAGDDAFAHALELAGRLDATLHLVYAVEPALDVPGDAVDETRSPGAEAADDSFVQGAIEDARAAGDRVLSNAAGRARAVGVDVETELTEGDPLDVLSALATETSADGIVVGHRPSNGVAGTESEVIESVAKGLIDRASVPVTVVTGT